MRFAAIGPSQEEPDAILWADESALRALIDALRAMQTDTWTAKLTDPPVEGPRPPLARVVISISGERVDVDVSDDTLSITGSHTSLARLATTSPATQTRTT
jgi:hypothetical protein